MWWKIVYLFIISSSVFSSLIKAGKLPLLSENEHTLSYRTPGCKLGRNFYDLEETFSPDIEPRGKQYCVKCVCMPIVKKGQLQQAGKVLCKNIKDQCPELNCGYNAVLLPEQCCKSCPGEEPFTPYDSLLTPSSDGKLPFYSSKKDDTIKEFVALMTSADLKKSKAVARGQLTLRYGNLHYSIQFLRMPTPILVRFTDSEDNILFEVPVDTVQKNIICGVWRNVPNIYLNFIAAGEMKINLATGEDEKAIVAGVLESHRALEDETFSALLAPARSKGFGAITMMTLAADGKTLMFILKYSGLTNNGDTKIEIKFSKGKRVYKLFTTTVTKSDSEIVEVWSKMSSGQLKQLVRGKLNMEVKVDGQKTLKGQITVKQTCGIYQSVLSEKETKENIGAAGFCIIKVSEKGRLDYKVHLSGLQSRVTSLTINTPTKKHGKTKRIYKLTSHYKTKTSDFDGWANGTIDKIRAKDIQLLSQGKLSMKIQTEKEVVALQGEIGFVPSPNYGVESIGTPYIVSGQGFIPAINTHTSGIAWLALNGCTLQYQVYLAGLSKQIDDSIMVQFKSPSFPDQTLVLNNFRQNLAEGLLENIPTDLMNAISFGDASLEVTTKSHPNGILSTKIHIPNECGKQDPNILREQDYEWFNEADKDSRTKCVYEGQLYEDNQSWIPGDNTSCTTCTCKTGKVKCHEARCPEMSCDSPVLLPGECCPQCLTVAEPNQKCYYDGDLRHHHEGTIWHPFVPPFGYSTCAVCFCKQPDASEGYDCRQLVCPPLDCPKEVAVRKADDACCKVCPDVSDLGNNLSDDEKDSSDVPADLQGDVVTGECLFQGTTRAPGETWHPNVPPFGPVKCVICACRNGKASCGRKQCDCTKKEDSEDRCCYNTCQEASSDNGNNHPNKRRKHKRKKNKKNRKN